MWRVIHRRGRLDFRGRAGLATLAACHENFLRLPLHPVPPTRRTVPGSGTERRGGAQNRKLAAVGWALAAALPRGLCHLHRGAGPGGRAVGGAAPSRSGSRAEPPHRRRASAATSQRSSVIHVMVPRQQHLRPIRGVVCTGLAGWRRRGSSAVTAAHPDRGDRARPYPVQPDPRRRAGLAGPGLWRPTDYGDPAEGGHGQPRPNALACGTRARAGRYRRRSPLNPRTALHPAGGAAAPAAPGEAPGTGGRWGTNTVPGRSVRGLRGGSGNRRPGSPPARGTLAGPSSGQRRSSTAWSPCATAGPTSRSALAWSPPKSPQPYAVAAGPAPSTAAVITAPSVYSAVHCASPVGHNHRASDCARGSWCWAAALRWRGQLAKRVRVISSTASRGATLSSRRSRQVMMASIRRTVDSGRLPSASWRSSSS